MPDTTVCYHILVDKKSQLYLKEEKTMRKIKMIKLGIGMAALSAFMLSTTVSAQNINENDIADQTVEEKNAEDQTVVDDNAVAPHVVEKLNQMAANKDRYYVPFEDNVAPGVIDIIKNLVENPDKTPQELFANRIVTYTGTHDDVFVKYLDDYFFDFDKETVFALNGQNGFFAYNNTTGEGEFVFESSIDDYNKAVDILNSFDEAYQFENYSWVSYLPDGSYQEIFYDPFDGIMTFRTANLRNR